MQHAHMPLLGGGCGLPASAPRTQRFASWQQTGRRARRREVAESAPAAAPRLHYRSATMEAAAALRKARIDALRRLRRAEDAHDTQAIAENEFGRAVKASYRSSVPPASYTVGPTVLETLEQGTFACRLPHFLADITGLQERVIAEDEAAQSQQLVGRATHLTHTGPCGDRAQAPECGPAASVRRAGGAARGAHQARHPRLDW